MVWSQKDRRIVTVQIYSHGFEVREKVHKRPSIVLGKFEVRVYFE